MQEVSLIGKVVHFWDTCAKKSFSGVVVEVLHTYLGPNVKIIFCNLIWPSQSESHFQFQTPNAQHEHIYWLHDAQHCILHLSLTLGFHFSVNTLR